MIGLIVAYSKNHCIGKDGKIPWRIKGEQKRFKELTTDNIVIMGRRSYEEIGRPLPNRITYVVSKNLNYQEENLKSANSLKEAIEKAKKNYPDKKIYISGGASLYEEGIELADVLYLTEIDLHIDGDTFFPEIDQKIWEKTQEEPVEGEIFYINYIYKRKE